MEIKNLKIYAEIIALSILLGLNPKAATPVFAEEVVSENPDNGNEDSNDNTNEDTNENENENIDDGNWDGEGGDEIDDDVETEQKRKHIHDKKKPKKEPEEPEYPTPVVPEAVYVPVVEVPTVVEQPIPQMGEDDFKKNMILFLAGAGLSASAIALFIKKLEEDSKHSEFTKRR